MKTTTRLLSALALAACATAVHAQTSPAPAAETTDEILILQPFNVSGSSSEGYRATRTISASRLNVPLAEVPVSIPVITADFINDAASNGQREALEWHSAVEGKSVRGFDTAEFYRHGFQHLSDTQGFLIQRMEVVRGPTAVLNGPIQPGGGINVITKQAVLDAAFGELRAQHTFGEERSYQSLGFDLNLGSLGPKADYGSTAGLRVITSYQHDSGRAIGVRTNHQSGIASLRLRPLRDTIVTFEYYGYTLDSDRTDHHLAANSGNNQTIAGAPNGRIPIFVAYDVPYWASWNGPDGRTPEDLDEFHVNINQKLADGMYLDLSFNRHDRNLRFKNTATHGNPAGGFALVQKPASNGDVTNPANFHLRRGLRNAFIGNVTDQVSALLTWAPEIGGERKHRFLAGWQTFEQDRRLLFADAFQVANPTQRYFQFFDPSNYRNETPRSLGVDFGAFFYDFANPVVNTVEANEQDTLFLTWNGKWLDDRLITMAGWFRTSMEQLQGVNGNAPTKRVDNSKSLPQLGFVYNFTGDLGVYGAYTKSSAINTNQAPPQNDPDFFFPPKSGEMAEVGLRFDLVDEKVIGSLGFYQIDQTDLVRIDSSGSLVRLGDVRSRGVDLDLFVYPAANWSVIFSYSHNDKTVPVNLAGTAADTDEFRSPPNKWSVWSKYSITTGAFAGVSFGGGFRWTEGTPFSLGGVNGTNPDKTRADVFIQKHGRINERVRYEVGLNIRNLTGRHNLSNAVVLNSATYAGAIPGTNRRYEFSTDPEFMFTFGLKY